MDQFQQDPSSNPVFWSEYYSNIYYFNAILNGIPQEDENALAKKLRAQALVGRAYEYLALINLYARPYNAQTADKDLGVPFVTSISISDETPSRGTVAMVYENIIKDLKTALPDLPESNTDNKFRANKASAYSILARTYWFQNKFDSAYNYATTAMKGYDLTDYNDLSLTEDNPTMQAPSVIFYRRINLNILNRTYTPSLELVNLYENGDLRLDFYYKDYDNDAAGKERGVVTYKNGYWESTQGTTVEEMMLIKAESAVYLHQTGEAIELINRLRKNRFRPEEFKPLSASSDQEAISLIYEERRREFAFTGTRWFDMRRLNALGLMERENRLNDNGDVIKSLLPDDKRYILQIPDKVIYANPTMPNNP